MEYFVADTYKGYDRIGEPFLNSKGKLFTKVRCECPRCSGLGIIAAGVCNGEIVPIPVDGGICYNCRGARYITKVVRLYTKAEYDTMQRNKERAAERKEEKALAAADDKRAKWLEKNGFNEEGYTYILVGLDSYAIKEQLKETGWKYDAFLRWHREAPGIYEQNVYKMHWKEAYTTTVWGDMYPVEGLQAKVDALINGPKAESTSEWFGEVGKRFTGVPVELVSVHGFMGKFGYSQVVTFKTAEGSILNWFTSVEINLEPGESCILAGTVKKHDTYKGENTTVVTRCKIS